MKKETIQEIQLLLNKGLEPKLIGKLTNVSPTTISNVKHGYYSEDGVLIRDVKKGKQSNVKIVSHVVADKNKDNWFYEQFKIKREKSNENMRGTRPELLDWEGTWVDECVKEYNKLQPYNKLNYNNGNVEPAEEELNELEKVLEKLKKKGIDITGINYQGLRKHTSKALSPFLGGDEGNVLVIGDLHCHHVIDGYLEFCREQQEKWNCGTVIYIGDLVNFASISFHEKLPEELNITGEIALARQVLKDWYATFPKAYVLDSNHDALPYRQARAAGLPREFIQSPHSIFGAPLTYEFVPELVRDGVLYTHGTKGDAFVKCVKEGINLVQGHLHTKGGVQYHSNRNGSLFGMQVGCGIDYKQQAFDYARSCPSDPVMGCGVVLNNGELPIFLSFTK